MQFIFATNNAHKVQEIKQVVAQDIEILTLKEAGICIDIPEPYDTLEENALTKAETIYSLTQKSCFSEDTGLEVVALNGAPGVKSARYAGEPADDKKNIDKLLRELNGVELRDARFRTVIALILNNEKYFFEGICIGKIAQTSSGAAGFGYDPIFIPEGANKTFAEMSMEEKNRYSHRKKAVKKLVAFLRNL